MWHVLALQNGHVSSLHMQCRSKRESSIGPCAGKAHTDFAEAKLQRRLIEGQLEDSEIDALSVVALAGASAEAMQYEEVSKQHQSCIAFLEKNFPDGRAHQILARPISGDARGQRDRCITCVVALAGASAECIKYGEVYSLHDGGSARVNEHATRSLTFGVPDGMLCNSQHLGINRL